MKIAEVRCHLVRAPRRQPFGRPVVTGLGPAAESETVLVEIRTDDGIVGVGEAASVFDRRGRDLAADIETRLVPLLIDADPLRIAWLDAAMRAALPGSEPARAAIDVALHDVAGKALGVPVWQLLGGMSRERIPLSYSIPWGTPDEAAGLAARLAAEGYRTVKVKVGESHERDVEAVRRVREAVGPDVIVRVDANMALVDVESAVRLIEAIEPFSPELLEQPLPPTRLAEIAEIRTRVRVPIMADESIWSPATALEVIRADAADVANVYLMESGGLAAARCNFQVCGAAGMRCMIGSMPELGVGTAAQIHLGIAVPNLDLASDTCGTEYHEYDFLTRRLAIDGGFAYPSTEPGLGVELDHAMIERFALAA